MYEGLSWAHGAKQGQGGRAGRDWGMQTASHSILVGSKAGGKVHPESR